MRMYFLGIDIQVVSGKLNNTCLLLLSESLFEYKISCCQLWRNQRSILQRIRLVSSWLVMGKVLGHLTQQNAQVLYLHRWDGYPQKDIVWSEMFPVKWQEHFLQQSQVQWFPSTSLKARERLVAFSIRERRFSCVRCSVWKLSSFIQIHPWILQRLKRREYLRDGTNNIKLMHFPATHWLLSQNISTAWDAWAELTQSLVGSLDGRWTGFFSNLIIDLLHRKLFIRAWQYFSWCLFVQVWDTTID